MVNNTLKCTYWLFFPFTKTKHNNCTYWLFFLCKLLLHFLVLAYALQKLAVKVSQEKEFWLSAKLQRFCLQILALCSFPITYSVSSFLPAFPYISSQLPLLLSLSQPEKLQFRRRCFFSGLPRNLGFSCTHKLCTCVHIHTYTYTHTHTHTHTAFYFLGIL